MLRVTCEEREVRGTMARSAGLFPRYVEQGRLPALLSSALLAHARSLGNPLQRALLFVTEQHKVPSDKLISITRHGKPRQTVSFLSIHLRIPK